MRGCPLSSLRCLRSQIAHPAPGPAPSPASRACRPVRAVAADGSLVAVRSVASPTLVFREKGKKAETGVGAPRPGPGAVIRHRVGGVTAPYRSQGVTWPRLASAAATARANRREMPYLDNSPTTLSQGVVSGCDRTGSRSQSLVFKCATLVQFLSGSLEFGLRAAGEHHPVVVIVVPQSKSSSEVAPGHAGSSASGAQRFGSPL